jgi:hypothetical protein
MRNRQILLTAGLSTFFTLTILVGVMLFLGQVLAAPSPQVAMMPTPAAVTATITYLSVTALAFVPVNPDSRYNKDPRRQLLTLAGQPAGLVDGNLFIAPLALPDKSLLTDMTVFGEDFDNQGAVLARLKRCDHSQARCLTLAETTSTIPYAAGQFETLKTAVPNEIVNNYFYSYILELELTAVGGGLRAVRLEMVSGASPPTPANAQSWTLTGAVTNFFLPNQGLTHVRVCTDNLSHLDNPTHYPYLVVDDQVLPLTSNTCVTVWGYTIEIRRELNTGPSSGTYQFWR